jgi:hypothetical protein
MLDIVDIELVDIEIATQLEELRQSRIEVQVPIADIDDFILVVA